LIRVAAELGTPYSALIANIHQVLQEGREGIRIALKDTLETLYQERPGAEAAVPKLFPNVRRSCRSASRTPGTERQEDR